MLRDNPLGVHTRRVSLFLQTHDKLGAFYVLDRGYTDSDRLKTIDSSGAIFVICAPKGLRFTRTFSCPVDKSRGINVDQTIHLVIKRSVEGYPEELRRIKFVDMEKNRTFTFLTNNFLLDAALIAELYRSRWKIELFFSKGVLRTSGSNSISVSRRSLAQH